jgi:hypothetical protein
MRGEEEKLLSSAHTHTKHIKTASTRMGTRQSTPSLPLDPMDGKTIVLTGGTDGMKKSVVLNVRSKYSFNNPLRNDKWT